jgi:hypothetical protein
MHGLRGGCGIADAFGLAGVIVEGGSEGGRKGGQE